MAKQLTDVCVFVLHQTKGRATEKNKVFDQDQEVYISSFALTDMRHKFVVA